MEESFKKKLEELNKVQKPSPYFVKWMEYLSKKWKRK